MRPLQPIFDPSKYSERASRIFQNYDGPQNPGLPLVGPFSYFHYQWAIEILRRKCDLGEATILTNLLIWGKGEPPLPYQTKFGGSPYRPAHLPWPRGEHGQFLPFIAQFNFSVSETHKHDKELLLIFGDIIEDELLEFHAEWHSPQDGEALSLVCPPQDLIWPKDVYHAEVAQIAIFPKFLSSEFLRNELRRITGLGSICSFFIPSASFAEGWDGIPADEDEDPKRIAAIQTFNPYFATELAWLNQDVPPEDVKKREKEHFLSGGFGPGGYPNRWFNIGDMGSLVIGINDAGEVEGWIESY